MEKGRPIDENSRRQRLIKMKVGMVKVFDKAVSSSVRGQMCEINRIMGNKYKSVTTNKQIRVTRIS